MIRLLVISILFVPLSLHAQKQKYECPDYYEGVFTYKDTLEDYIIIRTMTEQIEINTKKKEVSVAEVEWIQECNYDLTFRSLPRGYKFLEGKTLRCFINDMFYDGYSYTARMKGVVTKAVLVCYEGEVPDYSKWDGAE